MRHRSTSAAPPSYKGLRAKLRSAVKPALLSDSFHHTIVSALNEYADEHPWWRHRNERLRYVLAGATELRSLIGGVAEWGSAAESIGAIAQGIDDQVPWLRAFMEVNSAERPDVVRRRLLRARTFWALHSAGFELKRRDAAERVMSCVLAEAERVTSGRERLEIEIAIKGADPYYSAPQWRQWVEEFWAFLDRVDDARQDAAAEEAYQRLCEDPGGSTTETF